MAKRRFNGSLTGGTGDVNPQWLNLGAGAVSNAATWAEASASIPLDEFNTSMNKTVMEILKVQFIITGTTTVSVGANGSTRMYLSTTSWAAAEPTLLQQTGRVICKNSVQHIYIGTSTGGSSEELEKIIDITDGVGHGILVAVDTLYVGVIGTASSGLSGGNVSARILYRWKKIGLTEWIGMSQSQK